MQFIKGIKESETRRRINSTRKIWNESVLTRQNAVDDGNKNKLVISYHYKNPNTFSKQGSI